MKALIVGATGLIGKQVLELLNNDPEIEKVVSFNRNKEAVEGKINHQKIDFDHLKEVELKEGFPWAVVVV